LQSSAFALTILTSWICLVQYLRIFTEFRYLADLIVACLIYVKEFLLILFLLLSGFALAFYWRNKLPMEEEDSTVGEHFTNVFMNAFGDFSLVYSDMTFIDAFLLFLATFLICLVMMNLFIGILSAKLEEVLESKAENKNEFFELCELILQLEFLILDETLGNV
jgi:hypothetical protein